MKKILSLKKNGFYHFIYDLKKIHKVNEQKHFAAYLGDINRLDNSWYFKYQIQNIKKGCGSLSLKKRLSSSKMMNVNLEISTNVTDYSEANDILSNENNSFNKTNMVTTKNISMLGFILQKRVKFETENKYIHGSVDEVSFFSKDFKKVSTKYYYLELETAFTDSQNIKKLQHSFHVDLNKYALERIESSKYIDFIAASIF